MAALCSSSGQHTTLHYLKPYGTVVNGSSRTLKSREQGDTIPEVKSGWSNGCKCWHLYRRLVSLHTDASFSLSGIIKGQGYIPVRWKHSKSIQNRTSRGCGLRRGPRAREREQDRWIHFAAATLGLKFPTPVRWSQSPKFWPHHCSTHISPCPRCSGGRQLAQLAYWLIFSSIISYRWNSRVFNQFDLW